MRASDRIRRSWRVAAILAFAAAVAPFATPQAQDGDHYVITFSDEGSHLAEFVATAAAIMGEPFFVDPDEVRGVRIFAQGKTIVPRAKFMAFVDSRIRSVGFAHLETTVAGVRTHRLVRLDGRNGGQNALTRLKTMATIVDPSELPQLADRSTLVTTTYTCKNLPARELVTTLQLYFAEPATETIRTIEGTDFLVMTGPAAHVAEIVKMCERLDRDATGTRNESADDVEKRLAALEAQVGELAPKEK